MLKENKQTTVKADNNLFGKENYMWMIAGLVVLALGFFLMSGGKSADPKVFDKDSVYSTTRITIAPLLIIIGFILEIVGIMKKAKQI
jgi:Protein of unknown function (DUF3098)